MNVRKKASGAPALHIMISLLLIKAAIWNIYILIMYQITMCIVNAVCSDEFTQHCSSTSAIQSFLTVFQLIVWI